MPHIGLFFAGFYFSALLIALGWNLCRSLAMSIWLSGHRTRARHEPKCSDPIAVVFLVHGTWAPNAQWTHPRSALRSQVETTLGEGRVRFETFPWSGRNRISARRDAAARLRVELASSLQQWRGVPHYLVAHSHGGNIALSALDAPATADQIAGVICLSTPFLHARTRNLGTISSIALSAAPAYGLLSIGQLIALWFPAARDPVIGTFTALALGAVFVAPRWLRRVADRLQRSFVTTCMPPEKVLIIRTPGDEASAVLGTAHFVSWLTGMVWSIPSRALSNAVNTLERWNAVLAKHNAAVTSAASIALVLGVYLVLGESTPWQSLGVTLMTTSLIVFAIRLRGGTYGVLLGMLFAGVLVAPLPLILGLAALPFSPELAVAAILLEVTAESTPEGAWTVHQIGASGLSRDLQPAGSTTVAAVGQAMMHSLSYEHPLALRTMAAWLSLIASATAMKGGSAVPDRSNG